ncbi:MAG: hypothetical protein HOV79_25360 [Hamadaea sp.]|nr:hypothetical protein [Hamadaea sp.]
MAFDILEVVPHPLLQLAPGIVVHTGTVRIGRASGMVVLRSGGPPEEFGFFLPDVAPLAEGAAEPRLWAEAYLMVAVQAGTSGIYPIGVEQARAAYLPDPRGGGQRWLHLGGLAHAASGVRVGYRITEQSG